MTTHFKRQTDEEILTALAGLDRCSFFDERDQCRTVKLGCSCCDETFTEELRAARGKVLERRPLLCLSCDPKANETAFWGLTVRLGWGVE